MITSKNANTQDKIQRSTYDFDEVGERMTELIFALSKYEELDIFLRTVDEIFTL